MRIEDVIKKSIIEENNLDISINDIDDNMQLMGGTLNLDSVVLLELVINLEDEFDFMFEDDELTKEIFDSVASLSRYIKEKIGGY